MSGCGRIGSREGLVGEFGLQGVMRSALPLQKVTMDGTRGDIDIGRRDGGRLLGVCDATSLGLRSTGDKWSVTSDF